MRPDEIPLLVEDYLAGTLRGPERAALAAALAAEAGLRQDFLRQLRQAQAMDAALRERDPDELIQRVQYLLGKNRESQSLRTIQAVDNRLRRRAARRPKKRAQSRWPFAIIACAAAALIAIVLLTRTNDDARQPMLVVAKGAPLLLRAGTETRIGADTRLRSGDRIHVDAGVEAALRWSDEETTITLAGGVDLTVGDPSAGKRLRLDAGDLEAEVAKQPRGMPLVIDTPQAAATVVGTRFTLAIEGAATRLRVSEGRVRLERPGADALEVAAGADALADATGLHAAVAAAAPTVAKPDAGWVDLFAGGKTAWRVTAGDWRLEGAVAILQDPAGKGSRIESLSTYGNFEFTCRLRAPAGRTYTEIQIRDVAHSVCVHHTVAESDWKSVRITVRKGRIEGSANDVPLECDFTAPLPAIGGIAFYVARGRALEIADARIHELPGD
jgi:hypothetical protein